MSVIAFPHTIIETIRAHARRDYPHECCGALLGDDTGERRVVAAILPIENVSDEDRRRRFSVSPRDYIRAEREAERLGVALLGFYHSHPDHPPIPSETDRKFAQTGFSYPIITVGAAGSGEIRSWRITEREAAYREEGVEIITMASPTDDRPQTDQQ